jgi:hypothetical protein
MPLTKATYSMIRGAPHNVLDYGADPTGVQDSTAAIQACFNAATNTNQQVVIPSGFYIVTAQLNIITRPVKIQGAGEFYTTIQGQGLAAGQAIIKYGTTPADTGSEYFSISGLTLRSDDGVPNGLDITNGGYIEAHDIQFRDLFQGLVLSGNRCFTHSYRRLSGTGMSYSTAAIFGNLNGGQFYFGECTFSGPYGFIINDGAFTDGVTFVNCNFEGNSTNGFYLEGSCNGLSFFGCRSEAGGAYAIYLNPAVGQKVQGLTIQGCSLYTGSYAFGSVQFGNDGFLYGFNIEGNYLWGDEAIKFEASTGARTGSICFNSVNQSIPGPISGANTPATVLVANNSDGTNPIGRQFSNDYPGNYVPISSGAGTPEGVVTANPGALYVSTTGGAGTTLYVKESGTGNTGWVGK